MFDWLTKAAQGLGNFIDTKPEQFAIIADMMGSKVAPDNMFAGIGQHLGQSSLANKAVQEDRAMLQKIIDTLTAAGQPGGNSVNLQRDEDGNIKVKTDASIPSDALTMNQQTTPGFNMHDFLKSLETGYDRQGATKPPQGSPFAADYYGR